MLWPIIIIIIIIVVVIIIIIIITIIRRTGLVDLTMMPILIDGEF